MDEFKVLNFKIQIFKIWNSILKDLNYILKIEKFNKFEFQKFVLETKIRNL